MKNKFSFWKPVKPTRVKSKPLFSPVKLSRYPSRTKTEWRLIDKKPWGDTDKDKIINIFDCKPLNKKKHSGFFPPRFPLKDEEKRALIEHIKKTEEGKKSLKKFDYVYKGRGKWEGRTTDNYEFDVYPKGQRWRGKKKNIKIEDKKNLIKNEELKAKEKVVYRGMHEDEYKEAIKRGFFKSKGTHNLGQKEGRYTFGSKDIKTAAIYGSSFAPKLKKPLPGSTGYLVGFKEDEKWEGRDMNDKEKALISEGELATKEKIPTSEVIEAYEYVPTKLRKGEYWIHKGWDYQDSIDYHPETVEGAWKKIKEPEVLQTLDEQEPSEDIVEDMIESQALKTLSERYKTDEE